MKSEEILSLIKNKRQALTMMAAIKHYEKMVKRHQKYQEQTGTEQIKPEFLETEMENAHCLKLQIGNYVINSK